MFKHLILFLLLLFNASARQYIQCASHHNFDRFVLNLDLEQSTYFFTNGVHLPDDQRIEILKEVVETRSDKSYHYFTTETSSTTEYLKLANIYLQRALPYFPIELTIVRESDQYTHSQEFGCFSSLHD